MNDHEFELADFFVQGRRVSSRSKPTKFDDEFYHYKLDKTYKNFLGFYMGFNKCSFVVLSEILIRWRGLVTYIISDFYEIPTNIYKIQSELIATANRYPIYRCYVNNDLAFDTLRYAVLRSPEILSDSNNEIESNSRNIILASLLNEQKLYIQPDIKETILKKIEMYNPKSNDDATVEALLLALEGYR